MWKYVLVWFPMVAIAIANGVLRELFFRIGLRSLDKGHSELKDEAKLDHRVDAQTRSRP